MMRRTLQIPQRVRPAFRHSARAPSWEEQLEISPPGSDRYERVLIGTNHLRNVGRAALIATKQMGKFPGLNPATVARRTVARVAAGQKPDKAFVRSLGEQLPARALQKAINHVKKTGSFRGALYKVGV